MIKIEGIAKDVETLKINPLENKRHIHVVINSLVNDFYNPTNEAIKHYAHATNYEEKSFHYRTVLFNFTKLKFGFEILEMYIFGDNFGKVTENPISRLRLYKEIGETNTKLCEARKGFQTGEISKEELEFESTQVLKLFLKNIDIFLAEVLIWSMNK